MPTVKEFIFLIFLLKSPFIFKNKMWACNNFETVCDVHWFFCELEGIVRVKSYNSYSFKPWLYWNENQTVPAVSFALFAFIALQYAHSIYDLMGEGGNVGSVNEPLTCEGNSNWCYLDVRLGFLNIELFCSLQVDDRFPLFVSAWKKYETVLHQCGKKFSERKIRTGVFSSIFSLYSLPC